MRKVGTAFRTRQALLLILSLLILYWISLLTNYNNYSSGKIGIESVTSASSSAAKMNEYITMHDMMQMQNCSKSTRSKSIGTIRCPALVKTNRGRGRTVTSPIPKTSLSSYHMHMMAVYNGTVNRESFLHCMNNFTFPLNRNDPQECWPRPVILTSYPTSGNKLVRALLRNITSPMQTEMRQYHDKKDASVMFYELLDGGENDNNNTLNIYGTWNVPLAGKTTRTATSIADIPAIPLMGRVVVFKSHMGSDRADHKKHAGELDQIIQNGKLYGVLRIARNPGDHILRNKFRWKDKKCYAKEECFFKKANVLCSSLVALAQKYVDYHSFWDLYYSGNVSKTTTGIKGIPPQKIVYYEQLTSKFHVEESIAGVLQFLDELTPPEMTFKYGSLLTNEKVEEMKDVIVNPFYEHGTIVKHICGDKIAKEVHAATKVVSERLGYIFDENNATWSISKSKST